ncbi:4-hydroxy-tetrahydrodipicolinate synthase [Flavobacteriales bacterium]|nr:4-hydroxy-tetrahydrodipicolinate synthase [Flavobacteriales bacterium]
MKRIFGTGVALITPFNEDKTIDYPSFEKLINKVIEGGIDFLVVLGTTGEATSINESEKNELINFIVKLNNKRLPLVLGLGGNNTNKLIKEINNTDLSNFDAILSVTPYYNKPSQKGLYHHYSEISKSSPIPIILYNVPSRTGVNMSPEITIQLANDFKNIISIKEASGDINQIKYILKNKPKNFDVLSGDDGLTLEIIQNGGAGVISVIGQSNPVEFSSLVKFALNGKLSDAKLLHDKLYGLYHYLYSEGNPSGVKALLSLQGVCKNYLRLPLVPMSNKLFNDFKIYLANEVN